jgi:hypothetical protein
MGEMGKGEMGTAHAGKPPSLPRELRTPLVYTLFSALEFWDFYTLFSTLEFWKIFRGGKKLK